MDSLNRSLIEKLKALRPNADAPELSERAYRQAIDDCISVIRRQNQSEISGVDDLEELDQFLEAMRDGAYSVTDSLMEKASEHLHELRAYLATRKPVSVEADCCKGEAWHTHDCHSQTEQPDEAPTEMYNRIEARITAILHSHGIISDTITITQSMAITDVMTAFYQECLPVRESVARSPFTQRTERHTEILRGLMMSGITNEEIHKAIDWAFAQDCPDAESFSSIMILSEAAARFIDVRMQCWQPIETAPRDGTRVLVKFKDDLTKYEGMGKGSLELWQGLPFVGRHRGDIMEWAFAAPVGHGGFPDAWLAGWVPIKTDIEDENT